MTKQEKTYANEVSVAFYKGRGGSWKDKILDGVIRCVTRGIYSHCEIVIPAGDGEYFCYSASPRDGGVRMKKMALKPENWDIFQLKRLTATEVITYFDRTKNAKYDWLGAIGVIFLLPQKYRRFFCSEWVYNIIFKSDRGWVFSPNDLAQIIKDFKRID